jgi:hypothetical protein
VTTFFSSFSWSAWLSREYWSVNEHKYGENALLLGKTRKLQGWEERDECVCEKWGCLCVWGKEYSICFDVVVCRGRRESGCRPSLGKIRRVEGKGDERDWIVSIYFKRRDWRVYAYTSCERSTEEIKSPKLVVEWYRGIGVSWLVRFLFEGVCYSRICGSIRSLQNSWWTSKGV